ncbi:YkgJ family cysteine cluster protein [Horticoccus sp. 23ND18S-11]|uniref:YkgJ family cysteine cluster protein n=1 Tax=Horticoccus sp. 23ND18S-11 TaxID=3391832 RepID=UPI0039C9627B
MTPIATTEHNDIPACVGCARCCHLLVELEPGVDDVPESMVATYSGMRFMDQQSDGACVALDPETRACTIYERRPAVCRTFDRGGVLCRKILVGFQSLRDHTATSDAP